MYNFLIEFLGVLVITYTYFLSKSNPLFIGLVYAILLYLGNNLCTQHFNPAVTFAMASIYDSENNSRMKYSEVPVYIIAQLLGALSGVYLYSVFGNRDNIVSFCVPKI